MTVYLLRHGIAEEAPAGGDDRARRLTPRGRTRLAVAAQGLLALGIELDVILTSPLPRAAETAQRLEGVPQPLHPHPEAMERLG